MGILIATAILWWALMALVSIVAYALEHKDQFCANWMDETRRTLFFIPIPQNIRRSLPEDYVAQSDFDGKTIHTERDAIRLRRLYDRVFAVMSDGKPHTLAEIAQKAHGSEASVSARLRDMRKPKFGGHNVETEYISDGLFQYRLVKEKETKAVASDVAECAHV